MLSETEQFVNWVRRRSPEARTWKDYGYDLRFFMEIVGDRPLKAITFKDIDPDQANPHFGIPMNPVLVGSSAGEVHNIGEVWCSMLWEARARLIQKHGFNAGNQLMAVIWI